MTTDHHSPARVQRLRRGMTLRELAAACAQRGVPTNSSNLSKYELGKLTPRPRLRALLAEILELDVTDFETRRDEPTSAASADVAVHGVRVDERTEPNAMPELPDAREAREAS